MLSGNEALVICVPARDLFFHPRVWIFSMGRRYCESEGKCTGCQAHNGIILLFQYVCVWAFVKRRWWGQRTETFTAGRQESAVAPCRAAPWWDVAVPVPPCLFYLALGGTAWDSHCHTACPRGMGEACTAIHCTAACKPHKAKYSKAVMFPVLSLNFQNSDVKMSRANSVLPNCEDIYYKERMV